MLDQKGNAYEQLGEFALALENYREAHDLYLTFENKASAARMACGCADMLLCLDRQIEAENYLLKAKKLAHQDDFGTLRIIKTTEGELSLASNDLDHAQDAFEWLYHQAHQSEDHLSVVVAKGFLSEIAEREGLLNKQLIDEFIADLNTFGYDWVLRRHDDDWRNLYLACIENDWYVERLNPYLEVQKRHLLSSTKTKLALNLFGSFRACIDGHEVALSSRPQEVLAYLALNGRTRIDVLANAIWPDATLRSAKRNLAQQVRALRETLAQSSKTAINPLATENGAYKLSDNLEVHSDVQRLEKVANGASDDEIMQAVQRYEGELLPHIQSEWVLVLRHRYGLIAASSALTLAHKKEDESMEMAVELYEEAIRIEPFTQEAHEGLAAAYESLNNSAAALRVRRHWKHIEEGINPT